MKTIILLLLYACSMQADRTVETIPLPAGFHRVTSDAASFAAWLRKIPLKKDNTVYLYNGQRKANQDAQFAVLNISVGHEDLQQCADAVMRLRAEYLFSIHDFNAITFNTEQGVRLNFALWAAERKVQLVGNRKVEVGNGVVGNGVAANGVAGNAAEARIRSCFDSYLRTVFAYCSTRTLHKQLLPAHSFSAVQAGDVLIRAGSPGHAMLVMDVAEDNRGHRIYLLAQSYMPAQDIHVVKNPLDAALSPWYHADTTEVIIQTPEYDFTINELRVWPR
jgi:Domain of unknown function (4846)